jgi:methyltransferase
VTPAAGEDLRWLVFGVGAVVGLQRAIELVLARRNRQWASAHGAVEHGAAHYPLFFALHGAWLAGTIAEALAGGPALAPAWPACAVAYALASLLRGWAIATLGRRWNTRVLVFPGQAPIRRGPYRLLAHPNYLAVAIELAAIPLAFGAWITAAAAGLANAILLLAVRIPVERRALQAAADQS